MNIKIEKFEEDFGISIYGVFDAFDETDSLVPILINQGVWNKPSIEILKHNTPNSTI